MTTARSSLVVLLTVTAGACASNPAPPPVNADRSADPARDAPATPSMPNPPRPAGAGQRSASDILGDAIKAVGAPEAWSAHRTAHLTMTMSFQALGITGTVERFATSADKALVVTQIPGVGIIREGNNGKVVWSQDPINGLRILDGAEAEQARAESIWNPELRANELYQKVDALTQTGGDGRPLECVVLTPKLAPATTRCFDPGTHLQVLEKGIHPTPQGDTPFTSTIGDWRTVGGLRMPYALETQAGPVTFTAKVLTAVYDEPMDDKQFEPPQPTASTPASAEPAPSTATPPAPTKAGTTSGNKAGPKARGTKTKGAAKPKAAPKK